MKKRTSLALASVLSVGLLSSPISAWTTFANPSTAPLLLKVQSVPDSQDESAEQDAKKDRDEADARALEQEQRKLTGTELPLLSEERSERLDQLFDVLKKTENEQLAKKAQQEIEKLWLDSGSDTIDLLVQWAGDAANDKEYGKALDFLDNVVRLKPDYAEGWNKRATVHFLMKDYGKSIADVERVLELEPRHFGALAGLGSMLIEYSEEKRALEFMRRALELNPNLKRLKKRVETLKKKVEGRDA